MVASLAATSPSCRNCTAAIRRSAAACGGSCSRATRSAASAFRLGLFTQLSNPKPAVLFSAIFVGTVPPGTPAWVVVALLVVVFANETIWNTLVARIFSFNRTKAVYINLKTMIDRCFGGLLAVLGVKIALT